MIITKLEYEGYLTGDCECMCIADHPDPFKQNEDSRRYPLSELHAVLDDNKRYRFTLQVQVEELG